VIGGWIALQIISMASDEKDGVAYGAHAGGLVAGVVLFALMRPAGVKLLECIDPNGTAMPDRVTPPRQPESAAR
jgi:hypothetical protein